MDLRKELCEPFLGLRNETIDELESIMQKYAEYYHNLQLNKTNVSNQCLHENTIHQKLTCNVCFDCHEIIEIDV
jgi:hypothetical protein